MRILLVEDERRVADFIARGLGAEGYSVTLAADGEAGLAAARDGGFDVVVFDVMLPLLSGREAVAALRHAGNHVPVLMLTALDEIDDRVAALREGADDYLAKPFAFDELLARIEALGRRAARWQDGNGRQLRAGDLVFDRDKMAVTVAGKPLALTAKERGILELLMRRPGHVLSRERILNTVWGASEDPLTNVVDVYIGRMRRKLLDAGGSASIETVRGSGYRLQTGAEDAA